MKRSERRSAARLAASQALYQMEIADKGLADILAEFEAHWIGREIEGESYAPAELAFFRDVVSGVLRDQLPIDRGLDDALAKGWPLKRVEALMRAILRAAFYELRNRPDVPARVAVTEYVDVAKERQIRGRIGVPFDLLPEPMSLEFSEDIVETLVGDLHLVERLRGREPRR